MKKKPATKAKKKAAAPGPPQPGAARKTAAAAGAERPSPIIVGVGASAGGLEAFTQLLNALPSDTGMAFVLVQHLEPKHESVLNKLLARATRMPVQEVREGMHVEPDHVYVIPANADMSLVDGLLHIEGRKAAPGRHLPIDYFLTSLAEARGPQAIGVILSGTASDGTAGIRTIKNAGGFTFAQEPESAKFDGMPRSAIASGCVDLVLPPERIARELARFVHHPFLGSLGADEIPPFPEPQEDWSRLFRALRAASGVDFSLYKPSTVKRRLARRMAACKVGTLAAYLKTLERNPAELSALFNELLILVTEFFRDPEVFTALRVKIFPQILAKKPAGDSVRVWVAGCSTGQEAYSLAMTLLECPGAKAGGVQIQIFGTDVSEAAIEKARLGLYGAADVTGVSQQHLRRFFTRSNGNFQINQSVRETCVFARHDLTRDPPFSKLDLISCRNVLIYMEPVLQKRILAGFHWGLNSSGLLLLGKSESLGLHADLFTALDRKNKFFTKRVGAHVPMQPAYERGFQGKPPLKEVPAGARVDIEKEADLALWNHSGYAGLVVNSDLQILHVRGDTSPYIRLIPGKASLQLMRALREDIMLEVRSALQRARRSEGVVRREAVEFHYDGHTGRVNIEVRPLTHNEPDKSFLILFEGLPESPKAEKRAARAPTGKARDQEIAGLREELARTREYVQAIIRDQEASNEELKTANEETLSSNEELQSTNEELETAKEELQSNNEELVTLNEQLQSRNSELAALSTDLSGILSGVDIPIVILGSDRHIRRFTRPAEKLLGLISGDIGRPIGKLRIGINLPDLDGLLSEAVEKGRPALRDVQSESGRWYSLRIQPFKVSEEKLQGVLMAFVDINEAKVVQEQAAKSAQQSESRMRTLLKHSESTVLALLTTGAQAILAVDKEGYIRTANAVAETMFAYRSGALIGQPLESLIPERFRMGYAQHRAGWFEEPVNGPMGIGLDLAGLRSDGTEFPIEVSLSSISTDAGILGVAFISDITERKKNEEALAVNRDQLTSEVAALETLRATSDRLWKIHDLRAGLEEVVDAGIAVLGADMGSIRLFDRYKKILEIAAQRGFSSDFLDHFRQVSADDESPWGRTVRTGQRTIVEDVEADADFTAYRAVADAAGYRAVQSSPLLGSDGKVIGVFSLYFQKSHRFTDYESSRFDLYAYRAAQFVERLKVDEQLQRLTGELIRAREDSNRELARELHDSFSQDLVGLGMEVSSLRKSAKSRHELDRRLAALSKRATGIAERLHNAARKLHPAILEELGLQSALQQECDSFEKNRGIPTSFTTKNVQDGIPKDTALCLYRVAQESLRNISKHAADAGDVAISLTSDSDGITLEVRDSGRGFESDEAFRKGGLGLISMEERLRLVHGALNIRSEPGKGTVITAFVPLGRQDARSR